MFDLILINKKFRFTVIVEPEIPYFHPIYDIFIEFYDRFASNAIRPWKVAKSDFPTWLRSDKAKKIQIRSLLAVSLGTINFIRFHCLNENLQHNGVLAFFVSTKKAFFVCFPISWTWTSIIYFVFIPFNWVSVWQVLVKKIHKRIDFFFHLSWAIIFSFRRVDAEMVNLRAIFSRQSCLHLTIPYCWGKI